MNKKTPLIGVLVVALLVAGSWAYPRVSAYRDQINRERTIESLRQAMHSENVSNDQRRLYSFELANEKASCATIDSRILANDAAIRAASDRYLNMQAQIDILLDDDDFLVQSQ